MLNSLYTIQFYRILLTSIKSLSMNYLLLGYVAAAYSGTLSPCTNSFKFNIELFIILHEKERFTRLFKKRKLNVGYLTHLRTFKSLILNCSKRLRDDCTVYSYTFSVHCVWNITLHLHCGTKTAAP